MKKTLLISCTFLIFNFQFLIFNCNAQVDTAAFQTEQIYFEVDTIMANEINANEIDPFVVANATNKISKTKKNTPEDTVRIRKHSPKMASWLALIPGAGQIYNKKYWKLPIVYGGLATTGFLIYYYGDLTSIYRKEYVARVNGNDEDLNPDLAHITSDANILELRNYYRRNMEICVAACAIIYLLSILDASVDAHLFYYDVSDNLALGVKPKIEYNPITRVATPSVGLVLKF